MQTLKQGKYLLVAVKGSTHLHANRGYSLRDFPRVRLAGEQNLSLTNRFVWQLLADGGVLLQMWA